MIVETAKPRSCFLHVPKSGGTALTLYLRDVLGRNNVFHIGEGRYARTPLERLMKRYRVITGHFNVGRVPEHLFETTFFFTFLREPVDRILSMFHFFKEGDVDSDRRAVINEEWDLEHALDKWVCPGRCSAWSNEQTFLFSGETDLNRPPEELLPLALRNLERFDFVGLHAQFAEGVECLGRLRGWPLSTPVPRFKTSRKRLTVEEVDPAIAERIRVANRCDLALYHRASELWADARARAARRPAVNVPLAVTGGAGRTLLEKWPAESLLPRTEKGSKDISFYTVEMFDGRTGGDAVIRLGNPAEVRLAVYSTFDAADVHLNVRICDQTDMEVYGVGTRMQGRSLSLRADSITRATFRFEMALAPGGYFLSVELRGGPTHDGRVFHSIDNVMIFWCVDERPPVFNGLVDLHARVEMARPVFFGERQSPVREAYRRVRSKVRKTAIRSWHRLKTPLSYLDVLKFVRSVFGAWKRGRGTTTSPFPPGIASPHGGKPL